VIEFTIHPQVYSNGSSKGLISLLERAWVREHRLGDGHMVLMSGFGNYNGGVRFYDVFKNHIDSGGTATAIFGGSTSQRLTSKEVVEQMLKCGVDVRLVNRKRILHAKCYGSETSQGNILIVSSGNFTGPGMSQNIEGSLFLDRDTTRNMGFRWSDTLSAFMNQKWDYYRPTLSDRSAPAWKLLFDEIKQEVTLDDSEDVTMLLVLSHAQ